MEESDGIPRGEEAMDRTVASEDVRAEIVEVLTRGKVLHWLPEEEQEILQTDRVSGKPYTAEERLKLSEIARSKRKLTSEEWRELEQALPDRTLRSIKAMMGRTRRGMSEEQANVT